MDASGSDRKRGRGNNNSSTPTSSDAKDIPGYVYDPVRKRYFRSEEHAPNNNFNQPIDEILQRHRRQSEVRMRTWVHPSLEANHGLQKFLYEIESTWRSGKERRTICAAFQHRGLLSLADGVFDGTDGVHSPHRSVQLDGEAQSSFDVVSLPHFDATESEKKIIFGSGELNDNTTKTVLELRYANLKCENGILIPAVKSGSRSLCRTDVPSLQPSQSLATVAIHRIGMEDTIFLSCSRSSSAEPIPEGLFILMGATVGSVGLASVQTVTAGNSQHETIATTDGSTIIYFSQEELPMMQKMKVSYESRSVGTSLDFHPRDKGLLYCGTSRSQVLRKDFRQSARASTVLVHREAWDTLGVAGNCQVTTIKVLEKSNWFITSVAALPENAPKMCLWDARNTRCPFTTFDDSQRMPFCRKRLEISLSADESLAVATDITGLTRFWDVASGTLAASIPATSFPGCSAQPSHSNKPIPLVFYYGDNDKQALLVVKRGRNPGFVLRNLSNVFDGDN